MSEQSSSSNKPEANGAHKYPLLKYPYTRLPCYFHQRSFYRDSNMSPLSWKTRSIRWKFEVNLGIELKTSCIDGPALTNFINSYLSITPVRMAERSKALHSGRSLLKSPWVRILLLTLFRFLFVLGFGCHLR